MKNDLAKRIRDAGIQFPHEGGTSIIISNNKLSEILGDGDGDGTALSRERWRCEWSYGSGMVCGAKAKSWFEKNLTHHYGESQIFCERGHCNGGTAPGESKRYTL